MLLQGAWVKTVIHAPKVEEQGSRESVWSDHVGINSKEDPTWNILFMLHSIFFLMDRRMDGWWKEGRFFLCVQVIIEENFEIICKTRLSVFSFRFLSSILSLLTLSFVFIIYCSEELSTLEIELITRKIWGKPSLCRTWL